jgi:iron complex transport system ATP-binding protein
LGGRVVLEGVDLDLAAGELVAVVGPNGSGKSTLLQCLNGTRASVGTVTVTNQPLSALKARNAARALSLMHQNTSVSFAFAAREVVMMGRHALRGRFQAESAADREAVAEALAAVGAEPLAETAVTRMSGGERQRVLFAKSLAQQAPVMLLDEPTSSLDLSFQELLFGTARDWAAQGRAVLVAVHDLRLAARHCDRLVLLSQGRVLAAGTPAEVLTPENLSQAYGVKVRTYQNPVTGLLDYHVDASVEFSAAAHVHVIGGGGSAADVLRLLGDGGYRVTAGVLAPGDTDLSVASVYGVPVVTCPPFSAIPPAAFDENRALADRADLTVVSSLAFGPLNQRNLESALGARRLVLLEDEPPEGRDFTAGEGLALYRQLAARATVMTTAQFAQWLRAWSSSEP